MTSGDEQLDNLFFRFDITSFSDPLYTGIKPKKILEKMSS